VARALVTPAKLEGVITQRERGREIEDIAPLPVLLKLCRNEAARMLHAAFFDDPPLPGRISVVRSDGNFGWPVFFARHQHRRQHGVRALGESLPHFFLGTIAEGFEQRSQRPL
jgi:hypothetical protein